MMARENNVGDLLGDLLSFQMGLLAQMYSFVENHMTIPA